MFDKISAFLRNAKKNKICEVLVNYSDKRTL